MSIQEPWNLPWLKHITSEDAPELRQEGLDMINDLPAVDPVTIHPTSEVIVRAPSLAPQPQPTLDIPPWEINWVSPLEGAGEQPAPIAAKSEVVEEPERVINAETSQIASDEGTRVNGNGEFVSYVDRKGNNTGGIGHLLTQDEQKQYPEGAVIPREVSDQWFIVDMEEAEADADALLGKQDVPDEVHSILINMAFNLGRKKLKGFKKMWTAIKAGDWEAAADEMVDSDWFDQVGTRSDRLVARMRGVESN